MKNHIQGLCFIALLFTNNFSKAQVAKFNSYPSASPAIFLDFDGQTVTSVWNNYNTFVCEPANFSATEISYIFNKVSEDFRPFAVNVTTDSTKYFAADPTQRIRIIITPTNSWYPYTVGGVGYVGAFHWGNDIPAFVFPNMLGTTGNFNQVKNTVEAITHETGHALGLSHQAKFDVNCALVESYNSGYGAGETSWAPVMGKSYYKNMTGWSDGPTPGSCSALQDNLSIITTLNGFTYRTDDYAETMNISTFPLNQTSFNITGLITTPTDKDAFRLLNTLPIPLHIEANPYSVGANNEGANLDIMVKLYDANNILIRTYDPVNSMSVTIDTTLAAGIYYLMVNGAGNNNTNNYGSLGQYSLTGIGSALAIKDVSLKGTSDGKTHMLNWEVKSDEPIVKQVMETSDNGVKFEPIFTDAGMGKNIIYTPKTSGNTLYRLKVTSSISQVMYSNIISLKASGYDAFTVSTMATENIKIIAPQNFNYNLYDANAKLLSTGQKNKGINNIDVSHFTNGLYILQMVSNNYKQTERIIKQ